MCGNTTHHHNYDKPLLDQSTDEWDIGYFFFLRVFFVICGLSPQHNIWMTCKLQDDRDKLVY